MNTVVVVGNPKVGSRTRQAAELVVERLTGAPPAACIEVAELGPALLGWGDPTVEVAKQTVRDADLAVFASPTFKATYTGLLKLFLDQFAAGELVDTPAVALMLGASSAPRPGRRAHAQAGPLRDRLQLSGTRPVPARLDVAGEPRPRGLDRTGHCRPPARGPRPVLTGGLGGPSPSVGPSPPRALASALLRDLGYHHSCYTEMPFSEGPWPISMTTF